MRYKIILVILGAHGHEGYYHHSHSCGLDEYQVIISFTGQIGATILVSFRFHYNEKHCHSHHYVYSYIICWWSSSYSALFTMMGMQIFL